MLQRRTHRPPRNAATLVETAVVIVPMFLFLLGIIEYGRYLMMRHLMDNAAREGARLAIVSTSGGTTTDIENRVKDAMVGQQQNVTGLTIQVYEADAAGNNTGVWTGAAFGERIAVQVDAAYQPMVPTFGILPGSIPLQARSMMYSEAP